MNTVIRLKRSMGLLGCYIKGGDYLCVPNVGDMKMTLLEEARNSGYTIHPDSTKMYHDLKQLF